MRAVLPRFVRPDGSLTDQGAALLRDYEAGVANTVLYERYFIIGSNPAERLKAIVVAVGGTYRAQERMYVSTAELMRLYARHGDVRKVAALTGLTPIGVYHRLWRSGWTGIKGIRRRKDVEEAVHV